MSDPGVDTTREYFRRDQRAGISPLIFQRSVVSPITLCTRGKRTQYTSVSLDLARSRLRRKDRTIPIERQKAAAKGHGLIEHEAVIGELKVARDEMQAERLRGSGS